MTKQEDAMHTPGPWKCKRSATGSWLIVPEDYPSFKICRIENAITYIMDFDDAAEADARLIASAPSLAEENARLRDGLERAVTLLTLIRDARLLTEPLQHSLEAVVLPVARAALAPKEKEHD